MSPRRSVERLLHGLSDQNGPPFVSSDGIETDVGDHAVEPWTKRSAFYEALSMASRPEQRVLHGTLEGAEHAIRVDEDLPTMTASKMVEGLFVTHTNCRSQRYQLG